MSLPIRSVPLAGAVLAFLAFAAAQAEATPSFYDPPAELPADNGALVRSVPIRLKDNPGIATRIMYRSTDTNGQPVAVTGTYIEPTVAYARTGPRPLVSFAVGTQGQGDGCAPSYGLAGGFISGRPGMTNLGYANPSIAALTRRGVAVVVTDYVGLGTPNRVHTYVNRIDQGHAVLDAARAALQVGGTSVTADSPVGVYGYSQGGGAAGSAAELAPTYAPDVNLKAAYAGGPPADLQATMKHVDGTSLVAVIGYAINGLVETYPELKSILAAEVNAAGAAALKKIAGQCETDSLLTYGYKKTSSWTNSRKSVAQIAAASPTIKTIIEAQRLGRIKPEVPVQVLTGTKDDIVPHPQAKQLALDWCALGADVSYVPVKQQFGSFGTGLNHIAPQLSEDPRSQKWLLDRMDGIPSTPNCASVPRLP